MITAARRVGQTRGHRFLPRERLRAPHRDAVVHEDVIDAVGEAGRDVSVRRLPVLPHIHGPFIRRTNQPFSHRGRVRAPQLFPAEPTQHGGVHLAAGRGVVIARDNHRHGTPQRVGLEEQLHLAQEPPSLRQLNVRVFRIPEQVRGRHHDVPVRRRLRPEQREDADAIPDVLV